MRKNTKKLLIILLIILAILIVITIASLIILLTQDKKEKSDYKLDGLKEFSMCVDENNCPLPGGRATYAYMEMDTNIKVINDKLTSINKDTEKYYKKAKNSDMKSSECAENSKYFTHSFHTNNQYYQYENNNYISIGVKRVTYNLCTNESKSLKPEIYIYDKKTDKIINQDSFKKQLNMTEENIKSSINFYIMQLENLGANTFTLEDTYKNGKQETGLFYDVTGELYIYFKNYKNNTYEVASTAI